MNRGNCKVTLRQIIVNWPVFSPDEILRIQKNYEDHEKELIIENKHLKENAKYEN